VDFDETLRTGYIRLTDGRGSVTMSAVRGSQTNQFDKVPVSVRQIVDTISLEDGMARGLTA
jgi:hypothetical protein